MSSGSPNPMNISNMLEPNTFEVASSTSPFLALTMLMTASGIEVAAAVILKAIIIGETPRMVASFMDELVKTYVNVPIIIISPVKVNNSLSKRKS